MGTISDGDLKRLCRIEVQGFQIPLSGRVSRLWELGLGSGENPYE